MDPTAPEPGAAPVPDRAAPDAAAVPVAPFVPDPSVSGPLDRRTALAFLEIGDRLLAGDEPAQAGGYYQRVIGFDDPAITAAAILGFGNVLYRLDRDEDALATWREVIKLPETPSTYPAWRQIAAALVRDGDLTGGLRAYREADRRAPPEDKAEIASRLGWLTKETGDPRGARRYFARSRGQTGLPIPLTYLIIGLTVVVSLTASTTDETGQAIMNALALDKAAVAAGEWWRLLTVALVHAPIQENPLHLLLNMYALYLVGPIVERIYGWKVFGLMYVLCALTGSMASFLFGGPETSVGASGAIFGLFGVMLAATRAHHPLLDRRARGLVSQVGILIAINLVFDVVYNGAGGNIDIAAHLGGLAAGLWLGFVLVPGNVRSVRDLWQPAGGGTGPPLDAVGADRRLLFLVRLLAVLALVTVIVVGVAIGSDRSRFGSPGDGRPANVPHDLVARG